MFLCLSVCLSVCLSLSLSPSLSLAHSFPLSPFLSLSRLSRKFKSRMISIVTALYHGRKPLSVVVIRVKSTRSTGYPYTETRRSRMMDIAYRSSLAGTRPGTARGTREGARSSFSCMASPQDIFGLRLVAELGMAKHYH